jgi:hypothetical protein
VLLRRLRGADIDTTMLVMIGAWIALQNAEQLAWSGVAKSISNPVSRRAAGDRPGVGGLEPVFRLSCAAADRHHVLVIKNQARQGMRATFQDRDTAALMGIQIGTIHTATFALGSGLAAAAGALLGPVFVAYPSMGDLAAAKAFAIVILGGLGSIPAPPSAASSSRSRGARRGLHLLGLPRRDGLPAHHRDPALQAHGPFRAEGERSDEGDRDRRSGAFLRRSAVAGTPTSCTSSSSPASSSSPR